jgi:hypothetical protein
MSATVFASAFYITRVFGIALVRADRAYWLGTNTSLKKAKSAHKVGAQRAGDNYRTEAFQSAII